MAGLTTMRKFSRLEIFNIFGLLLVVFLAFKFYKFATNPVPPDLEHNLNLEVNELNKKIDGSIIFGSFRLEKSEASGATIIIKLREINKDYNRKLVLDNLIEIFCGAILNGADSDAHRSSIEIRLYNFSDEHYEPLQINPEKCRSYGYSPVTG